MVTFFEETLLAFCESARLDGCAGKVILILLEIRLECYMRHQYIISNTTLMLRSDAPNSAICKVRTSERYSYLQFTIQPYRSMSTTSYSFNMKMFRLGLHSGDTDLCHSFFLFYKNQISHDDSKVVHSGVIESHTFSMFLKPNGTVYLVTSKLFISLQSP